ncbi:hypothetical protein BUALT_Bualt19G0013000 [Buddleja alternifolia]|uniref:Uncharacterized protein n=1 Tax=Buddleja alternifolia TaxID=168488 RepID=A0AAV6W7S9_9LAMI|nr:hypothetical protein BUALT_Bualt19G0013000 [Buddleja alternifolia]
MFSNAGILGQFDSFLEMDLNGFDKTMAVNARGAAIAIKHAARAMVAGKVSGGSIICTASSESARAGGGPAAYVASKHAVLGLVRAAARELGQFGIRVNCVSPHGVATPMLCGAMRMDAASVEARLVASGNVNLKGVVLKENHVAEAVLFLASDESGYVSAANVAVDGGITAVMGTRIEI